MVILKEIIMIFGLAITILFAFSCTNDEVINQSEVEIFQGEIVDSIGLFTDSTSYRYVNTEKLKEGSLIAYQHPMLNLTSLNSNGEWVSNISKKGDGLSEFSGIFIDPIWVNDKLLVIDQEESSSKVFIFNDQYQYQDQLRILDDTDFIMSPVLGKAVAIEKNDTIFLYGNIDNKLYSIWDNNLYKSGFGMVKVKIFNNKVVSTEFGLPIEKIKHLSSSVNNGERDWASITAHFDVVEDKIFVKYSFDRNVYIYDLDFNLINQIELSTYHESKDFKIKIGKIEVTEKRLFLDRKIKCSNAYFHSIRVSGNKVFLLYRKPLADSQIPKTMADEYNSSYQNVLHVYDLKTKKEYSTDLPLAFSSYATINLKDNSNIYFIGNEKETEDIYLYEYKLSF